MTTIGARLRFAREAARFSQVELARRIGIRSQTVNQWESGAKNPGRINLFKAIDILNVPPMWVIYGGALPEQDTNGCFVTEINSRMVPMLSLNSVTADLVHRVDLSSIDVKKKIPANFPCGDRAFAIEVPNDSNAPRYPKGTRWIMDPHESPLPGDMVVALYGASAQPIIGEIHFETAATGQVTIVSPLNPKWPRSRSDLDALEILAVMTESIERRRN